LLEKRQKLSRVFGVFALRNIENRPILQMLNKITPKRLGQKFFKTELFEIKGHTFGCLYKNSV
jgi:hypothetical protein